jgi:hypothetical protein
VGLLHRLLGGKLPAWAKSSPHDAKSAAALVEAIQRYVVDNGGTIELFEETAKVSGPRGERVVKFGDFVFICPADSTETWNKMIAHALRDVIPDAAVIAEARTTLEKLMREKQDQLDAIASSPELAQAHLRLSLRVHGFRVEVPALIKPVKRDAFDRFEALAIYDFLPTAEGLPASHLANWNLDDDAILARAEENTFAAEASQSGDRVLSIAGPFAGSRIVSPARLGDSAELGLLISAPNQDLCMLHRVSDGSVLDALDEMVNRTYELHDKGPVGGTGRALFWWRKGVYQEIPTSARTIVREGSHPYEYRLPDRFKRDVLKPLGLEG